MFSYVYSHICAPIVLSWKEALECLEIKYGHVKSTARKKFGRGENQKGEDKREDAGARNGRKVTKHCVYPMFCSSTGAKSRLAKAAGV